MKIQRSDIRQFLQFARKMWKSNYEGALQIVVFTSTERSFSIAMAWDGRLLTYLCNHFDTEASEQAIAVPIGLLKDCSNGTGTVELHEVVANGALLITAKWSGGLVRCERTYATQEPPEYHSLPDLAWHTVDERMQRGAATESNREEKRPSHRLASSPILPRTTVFH